MNDCHPQHQLSLLHSKNYSFPDILSSSRKVTRISHTSPISKLLYISHFTLIQLHPEHPSTTLQLAICWCRILHYVKVTHTKSLPNDSIASPTCFINMLMNKQVHGFWLIECKLQRDTERAFCLQVPGCSTAKHHCHQIQSCNQGFKCQRKCRKPQQGTVFKLTA